MCCRMRYVHYGILFPILQQTMTSVPTVVIVLTAVLVGTRAVYSSEEKCIRAFHELRESFLSRKDNIDSMRRALLPPSSTSHILIDVHYHYTTTLTQVCTNSSEYSEACKSNPIHLPSMPYDYKFRWSSSSVHIFIRPKLLKSLSLYTYQSQFTEAHIVLGPICSSRRDHNRSTVCREPPEDITSPELEVRLLDELTSHVSCISHQGLAVCIVGNVTVLCPHEQHHEVSMSCCISQPIGYSVMQWYMLSPHS